MKTMMIMSVLMAAISMNAFGASASNQCQQGSSADAAQTELSKSNQEKIDAKDQFETSKDSAEKK